MPDPWVVRNNIAFPREGRCLFFAAYSSSLRHCHACRTIAWCRFYDHAATRQFDLTALGQWEDDGGQLVTQT